MKNRIIGSGSTLVLNFHHIILALFAILLMSGCTLMDAREQAETLETAGTIKGRVIVTSSQKGPVIVLRLHEKNGGLVQEGQAVASSKGNYTLPVFSGDYHIAAFIDVNHNGRFDAGEHGCYDTNLNATHVAADETIVVPDMTIAGEPPPRPSEVSADIPTALAVKNIGRIVSLSDPIFSPENRAMGMWRPMEFLDQVGGGLFMLQNDEQGKTPVIFVHGMGGDPHDWEAAINGIDREQFQPWVFYYPSGLRLDLISGYLVSAVAELKARYDISDVCVVAHSMGGLVTRSFIKKYVNQFPEHAKDIQCVITVNSPMGGMPSAASGVEHSPVVLCAWRDVVPDSEFLQDLHAWDWPRHIPYHLVFSFEKGEGSDGTVPLDRQIPFKLQSEAVRMYGFTNTHVGTLSDPAFLTLFEQILADALADMQKK